MPALDSKNCTNSQIFMQFLKSKIATIFDNLVVRKTETLVPVRVSGFKNLSVDQIVWMKLPGVACFLSPSTFLTTSILSP